MPRNQSFSARDDICELPNRRTYLGCPNFLKRFIKSSVTSLRTDRQDLEDCVRARVQAELARIHQKLSATVSVDGQDTYQDPRH